MDTPTIRTTIRTANNGGLEFKLDFQDIDIFRRKLTLLESEQLPYAMMTALNNTLRKTHLNIRDRIPELFHHTSAFTFNTLYVSQWAKKEALWGTIGFKWYRDMSPRKAFYLEPEIEGGERKQEPFEYDLALSSVISKNEYLVKTDAGRRLFGEQYPPQLYEQILSYFRANPGGIGNRNPSGKRTFDRNDTTFFAGIPRNHRNDYWALYIRKGNYLTPLFHKTQGTPSYAKKFPFYEMFQEHAMINFQTEWPICWDNAIATAH